MIIDTHSHIYSEQFDADRDEMIQRAIDNNVGYIMMPNVDIDSIQPMLDIETKYPKHCLPMMGLHPTSVNANYKEQLDEMYAHLKTHHYYAIGEIGIDLYWDKTFVQEQIDAFKSQINWAKEYKIPIVIHARDAFDEVFEAMDSIETKGVTGIFHSFTGNLEQAKKALSYDGFKLSVNGVLTFKNSGLDKVVQHLSIDDLVVETDAPYLTPTPFRGKRNEPNYVHMVADKLATIFDISVDEVNKITTANAKNIFKL